MRIKLGVSNSEPYKIDEDGYKHYDYHTEVKECTRVRIDGAYRLFIELPNGEVEYYPMMQENRAVVEFEVIEESK